MDCSLRSSRRLISACAACLVVTCQIDACPPQTRPTTVSERLQAFQWFSGLGFPDVKDGSFVRLHERGGQHGFVLEQNKEAFIVVTVGLDSRSIDRQQRTSAGGAAARPASPKILRSL